MGSTLTSGSFLLSIFIAWTVLNHSWAGIILKELGENLDKEYSTNFQHVGEVIILISVRRRKEPISTPT